VLQTLEGLCRQDGVRLNVLFLDQAEGSGIGGNMAALAPNPNVRIERITIPARSLSHARNAATARASTDIVLFIDADAVPHPRWASELTRTLSSDDPMIAVAGGRVRLKWHSRPNPLAASRLVSEQYGVLDFGDGETEVRKVIGASFAIRKDRFSTEMRFDEGLGRRGGRLFGGEETDLCARVRMLGGKVIYNGRAIVDHQVMPERS
jgi:cellulose synthase/poly-beta-1,6-N-acetylglucosamine synthase-like glycosyltransferase